ncbi:hypothetical protein NADFUDRAFT_51670 [Nadsonia fulvescens var. elongata DSM 6958]|uniref:Uncharacterized protein n=1 Tax=Nadsonia fulvescens var. elongata DSM 6958 TaxID=857566 RepID=A0A1E3PI31_9ASCO|nr:hypothetical protein NADFUDRAFT_51670 [Nadsonia fulvescens var. elongata DSM 6958]
MSSDLGSSSPNNQRNEPQGTKSNPPAPANSDSDPNNIKNSKIYLPVTLIPVAFKEASIDSPTFRAYINYLTIQVDMLDRWVDGISKALGRLSTEMDTVQEAVNGVITKFILSLVADGIIDHDYTMLATRRYAEGAKYFWSRLIRSIKFHNLHFTEPLAELQKTEIRSFKEFGRTFEVAQSKYDGMLTRYTSLSKTKEPSALRESAFLLYEVRKQYIKASFDISVAIINLHRSVDRILVNAVSDWFLSVQHVGTDSSNELFIKLGIEMHRLRSWSNASELAFDSIHKDMISARKRIEESTLTAILPSRDLKDYTLASAPSKFVFEFSAASSPAEKHGWLFVRTTVKQMRQVWVRRWVFVKSGIFGWLTLSPQKTSVQESDKIGVLLCNIRPIDDEDRRFCFEIKTKDTALIVQAESQAEMTSWLNVFDLLKRQSLEADKDGSSSAFKRFTPPFQEFASNQNTSVDNELTHDNNVSDAAQFENVIKKAGINTNGLNNNNQPGSTLQQFLSVGKIVADTFKTGNMDLLASGPFGTSLAPSPLMNTPITTALTRLALFAGAFITPTAVPTAMTSNVWGSVNWGLYQKVSVSLGEEENQPEKVSNDKLGNAYEAISYPESYPLELKSQDFQMRSIFQTLVDNDLNDRVVTVFRCLWNPNPLQELPGRIFVTLRNIYLYSCSLGFVSIRKLPLTHLIGVEGSPESGWDNLHFLTENGSIMKCRVFLDSGRLLQRRFQILIANCNAASPRNLEEMIPILTECDPKGIVLKQSDTDGWHEREQDDLDEEGEPSTFSSAFNSGTISDNLIGRYKLNQNKRNSVLTRNMPAVNFAGQENDLNNNALIVDYIKGMTLDYENHFNVSAKAMYHIMFGNKSPLFSNRYSRFFSFSNVKRSDWYETLDKQLERKVDYDMIFGTLLRSKNIGRMSYIQKIEYVDDNNCYLICDSKPQFKIATSVMSINLKYAILATKKKGCVVRIWHKIDCIEKGFVFTRSVVTRAVNGVLAEDIKQLNLILTANCDKVGDQAQLVRAIKLFGHLSPTNEQGNVADTISEKEKPMPPINISLTDFLFWVFLSALCRVLTFASFFISIAANATRVLWREVSLNRTLALSLILSSLINFAFVGRTSYVYWVSRHADKHISQIISPTKGTIMKRAIYLSEINDLIKESNEVVHMPDSKCYGKFHEAIAQFTNTNYDTSALVTHSNDDSELTNSKSIVKFIQVRDALSIKRNELLVDLRTVNSIEQKLLDSTWKNWVLDESHLCEIAKSKIMGTILEPDSHSNDISVAKTRALFQYCDSCQSESKLLTEGDGTLM